MNPIFSLHILAGYLKILLYTTKIILSINIVEVWHSYRMTTFNKEPQKANEKFYIIKYDNYS